MVRGYSRGYGNRGGGSSSHRGSSYRSSNYNSGGRMQNSGRSDRYGSSSGGSGRYNSSSHGASSSSHYDSRNRDRFNNSSSSSRHDSTHKRSYNRDSSRDRSTDRKRPRQDDYRRTSSTGRGNRTPPPPPPPPVSSSSSSAYRGGSSRHDDRDKSRHRSPMGPPSKRPPIRSGFVSRIRGSSNRGGGMRTGRGGTGRIIRRESNDLRIMRRKLMYAQQKDRARVLKIARLTSSLRRRRIDRNSSKSPRRSSRSNKKDDDSSDEDDDDEKKTKSKSTKGSDNEEEEDDALTAIGSLFRGDSSFTRPRIAILSYEEICTYNRIVFYIMKQLLPASLLRILLIRAGIEPNPGPTVWICSVCKKRIHPNATSVRCNRCYNWLHQRNCSGLRHHSNYRDNYIGPCCPVVNNAPNSSTNMHVVTTPAPSSTHWPNPSPAATASLQQRFGNTPNSRNVWLCSVCNKRIYRNVSSVQCNICYNWCHLRSCSGLASHKNWNTTFIAPCCSGPSGSTPGSSTPISAHASVSSTNPQPTLPLTPQSTPNSDSSSSSESLNNVTTASNNPHFITPLPVLNNSTSYNLNSSSLKILQLNCNGLWGKVAEIVNFMENNNILVAAIQETKLHTSTRLNHSGSFNIIRKDRDRDKGGGLAFIIHQSVRYSIIQPPNSPEPDEYMELQAITLHSNNSDLEIFNIYIPPVTCCRRSYKPSIQHLLEGSNRLLVGDLNAHHVCWLSNYSTDRRGTFIMDQIDNSNFGIINEDMPTRISGSHRTSPDLSIASSTLIPYTSWHTILTFGSDHLPIVIGIESPDVFVEADRSSYLNYNKADWNRFLEMTENQFSMLSPPTDVHSGEKLFRKIIKKAAQHCIPAGRYSRIRPMFPPDAVNMANIRDNLRAINPEDPHIQELNRDINIAVNEYKKSKWLEHLEDCNFGNNSKKLWSTIKSLSNPGSPNNNNIAIAFNQDPPTSDALKCAKKFCHQFVEHPNTHDRRKRVLLRKFRALKNTNSSSLFSVEEVKAAILHSKPSKALGPDGLSNLMLKHLGSHGIDYLTTIFNLSLNSLIIPDLWKVGKIIPLLKPGKPEGQGNSYRPISLLSPAVKILEFLILPHLQQNLHLANHQHGFLKNHSTTTALNEIVTQVTQGFDQKPFHRTIVVALDLTKAFDTVNISILLNDIINSTLDDKIKRWLVGYLNGRQSFVEFRGRKSKHKIVKQGVPQGGVLSPMLFNFYMSKLPTPSQGVNIVSYADDCFVYSTGRYINVISNQINAYLEELNAFLLSRNLTLSASKSTATLFTNWTREVNDNLNITVNNRLIPTVKRPKMLGVNFDNLLSFSTQASTLKNRVTNRNNALKALAGSSWGKDKETLIVTYKAICRSILNYAAPIWTPFISHTQWQNLQVSQNAALRIATGCLLMSDIDHLHDETKILPVRNHNEMLAKQFLLACHVPDHPNHHLLHLDSPPRLIKKDIRKYLPDVADFPLQNIDCDSARFYSNIIHTQTVNTYKHNQVDNIVLGGRPPPVDDSELSLPRNTRSILAQLRSGYCARLNHYLSRIDPNTLDICNEEDDDDEEEVNDDDKADKDENREDGETKSKRSKSKRSKSSEKSNVDEDEDDEEIKTSTGKGKDNNDEDEEEDVDGDEKADKKSQREKKEHVEGEEGADKADEGDDNDIATDKKTTTDAEGEKSDKKEGKKKDSTESSSKKEKPTSSSSSAKKTSSSSSTKKKDDKDKDDKEKKSKKSSRSDDEDDKERKSSRTSRRDDRGSPARRGGGGSRFIKLTCIHCNMKCVTFKEYSYHLNSRTHKMALRQIAMRQRAHLLRLRARQRAAQKELEEKSKETYESKFCHLCRLHYRQPKAKHQLSEHHKIMKKFLMPYCSTCHLAFKSPILYETHRCSLEHIRNKARKQDSDSENSGDEEMREIDLNKFMTVDSVGEIDEEIDADVEALLNETQTNEENSEDNSEEKERTPVGSEFVKEITAFYCEICEHYSADKGSLEAYTKKHCLQRSHLKAYLRHKEEEKNAKKRKEARDKKKSESDKMEDSVKTEKTEEEIKKEAEDVDEEANGEHEVEAEHDDEEPHDDKLWEDVDKDLGDLLREVGPDEHDEDEEDEEENDSVLNIDIESEKQKKKEVNGKKDDSKDDAEENEDSKDDVEEEAVKEKATAVTSPTKAKPQRTSKTGSSAASATNTTKTTKEAEAKE